MRYLILVSIGPVQSFISSARRTRDLWFGSRLLSELSKAAASQIAKINGELIFPAPAPASTDLESGSPLNVANKILALVDIPVESANQPVNEQELYLKQQLQVVGDDVYVTIKAYLNTLYTKVSQETFEKLHNQERDLFKQEDVSRAKEVMQRQIEDLIEYFWVAVPYREGLYGEARRQVEKLMAMRKNTRNFNAVTWSSTWAKSSIDGQLESVIPASLYPRFGLDEDKAMRLYRYFRAGPAETLSGVDLLKRIGKIEATSSNPTSSEEGTPSFPEHEFPSTSHMASIPYLRLLRQLDAPKKILSRRGTDATEQWSTTEAQKKWNAYIDKVILIPLSDRETRQRADASAQVLEHIKGYPEHPVLGNLDGSLLFEERLFDVRQGEKHFKAAIQALEDFFAYVNRCCGETSYPDPYYALLRADGDGMGEVIDHQANQESGEPPIERHRDLSRKMAQFAAKARKIVEGDTIDLKDRKQEGNQGALIYSGGDDVLALVPLHTALKCAQELSSEFNTQFDKYKNKQGNPPTLSVGIAIVHHLELMSEALKTANAAEKSAKSVKEKNALAITIKKRSGEEYSLQDKWANIKAYLAQLIEACRVGDIPKGTAYEIREMTQRLNVSVIPSDDSEEEKKRQERQQVVIWIDTVRILRRKLLLGYATMDEDRKQRARALLRLLIGRLPRIQNADFTTLLTNLPAEIKEFLPEEPQTPTARDVEAFINELIIAQELAAAQRLAYGKEL